MEGGSGVISRTTGPATGGATFEGAAALSADTVITLNFSNCTPASNTSTATNYYDSNYLPLGEINQDGSYSLYLVPPTIPNTVKVGAVGIIGTRTLYANSTKAVIVGRLDSSFVIDPDTADTAILRSITKKYDANAQLLYTEQDKYRMTGAGSMSAIAVDIQYANTSTVHFVFK